MGLKLKLAQGANPNTLDDGRPIAPGEEFVIKDRELTVRERQLLIDEELILLEGTVEDISAPAPVEPADESTDTSTNDNTDDAPEPPKQVTRARGGKS